MKKNLNIVILLLSIFAFSIISCNKDNKKNNKDDDEMSVDVLPVQEDSILIRKTYPGVLESKSSADVVARVSGTIETQLFKAGDYVTKGQPLFTIESTTYKDAVKEAYAELNDAKASYEYASSQYQALKRAFNADAVAEMEVIQAKSNLEQVNSKIRQAQAALKDAQTQLGYCVVRAPISGYITDSDFKPGAYVAGQNAPVTLATVYDNSILEVSFSISDGAYIEMFTSGNNNQILNFEEMPIKFSQNLKHDYSGNISYLSPTINTSTGTLEIKARVNNPYNELRNGMYVNIALPFQVEQHAMLVKDASVQTDQKGSYLYVVNDSNKVVYTPVTAGVLYQDTLRVIESGVKPGDLYVSKAMLKMHTGMKVKPVRK